MKIENINDCINLVKDEITIGYAKINPIEVFVDENYRGNGYGKMLFKALLEEAKNKGLDHLNVKFSKKNIPMRKIITDFNGERISLDDDDLTYVISLKE